MGRPPDFVFSDMAGWGPYLPRIFTIQAYSVAACLAIATLGYLVLVRGTDDGWAVATRMPPDSGCRHGGAFAAGVFVVAAIALGGLFFYNANVLNAYTEVHVAERRVKDWEVRYKTLASLPQPRLIAVTLHHDFYPERRAASWKGTLRAVNRDPRSVDTLFVSLPATGATSRESLRGVSRHRTFARFAGVQPRRIAHSRRPRERRAAVSIRAPARDWRDADGAFCRTLRAARLSKRRVQQRRRRERLVHEFAVRPEFRLSGRIRIERRRHSASATVSSRSRG